MSVIYLDKFPKRIPLLDRDEKISFVEFALFHLDPLDNLEKHPECEYPLVFTRGLGVIKGQLELKWDGYPKEAIDRVDRIILSIAAWLKSSFGNTLGSDDDIMVGGKYAFKLELSRCHRGREVLKLCPA